MFRLFIFIESILLQAAFLPCCLGQQTVVHSFTIEDGLVNNDVLNIRQDSRGFIWLCTRGGLSRYDGTRFTNFTTANGLTNDMINDIVETGPQQFIVAQNLRGPKLLNNNQVMDLRNKNNLTLNGFYKLPNGRWIATTDQQGIVMMEKNNFYPLRSGYTKSMVALGRLNDSLFVTAENNTGIQLLTRQLQPWSAATPVEVTTIYNDSRQRVWVGSLTGLQLLDQTQHQSKPIVFAELPPQFSTPLLKKTGITAILEDSHGDYWFGTTGAGLARIAPGKKPAVYTEANGLPASYINCIREDDHGNIWVGTTMGLAKMSAGSPIKIITQKDGLPAKGSGSILTASPGNVDLFDEHAISELNLATGSFKYAPYKNPLADKVLRLGKNELLMLTKNGTVCYKGNDRPKKIKWPDQYFYAVIRLDSTHLAGVSNNQVFVIENGLAVKAVALPQYTKINLLATGPGNALWAGTFDHGAYKINWSKNKNSGLVSMKLTDSLTRGSPDLHTRAIFCDDQQEVWIGTRYKGLVQLVQTSQGQQMRSYGTAEGLSSNYVKTITRDPRGNIWVGTPQGPDKLIPARGQYRVFNFGKINNCYYEVLYIHFTDSSHLLTEGQVMIQATDAQQDSLSAPPVYITNAFLPDRLSYRRPQIDFEFCAPQSVTDQWNIYQYRLRGRGDTAWTNAGRSGSVYFASLEPGQYIFEVRILGMNGRWGIPAQHAFIVDTPFWQTAWFIFILVASVGAAAFALYRYRVHQIIRVQQVRNRIAADLHDEIGSSLTNISILTALSKNNKAVPNQANVFLQRIGEEAAQSSQSLDDIIWSVNTSHDTLEQTVSRMRLFAAELFDSAGICYELQLDTAFESTRLIMEQRRDFYLIYKEALSNIVKHARAKHVQIHISIRRNQLLMRIEDDGIGFETGALTGRHGLSGMRGRVHKWNGKITLDSVAGKGTLLQTELPLAN